MKVVVLGAPRSPQEECWKDDLAEGGRQLGWDVTHLPARDIPAGDVVTACRGADLLVWARTHGHDPSGDGEAMLRRIEDAGTITAGVHFDLYWGLRRQVRVGNEAWWTCHHVFTADGGDRDWASRGVNHHWLPPAFGTRFFGRAEPTGTQREAVFVGTSVSSIHGQHRRDLIRWARHRWGPRFRHIGATTRQKVWGARLNGIYAASRVVLGDSAPADYYWSDRIPRTLGRGGLLCYPHTPGLDEQGYASDVMIRYERFDFTGLGEQIKALTGQRRREMTDAALTLIEERHLMRHRMAEIARVAGLT